MKKVVHTQAESMLKSKKVHRYLRRAVALLSVVVMLFTINTLKKRANTLERIPMCGMEEHLHDESCFNELGELICLLPEHQHTDACFQQAPVHEESAEEFAEEMEVDLSTEDESEVESQEALPVEELPVEEEPGFELSQPALLSDILQAMNLPVTLNDVIDVGQVVNTEADAGLVSVERQENGDALVSANAAFDAAELAIITETDILTVKLVAGAAAAEPVAEEPVVEPVEEPVAEPVVEEPAEEIPAETVEETVEATAEDGIVEEIAPVAEEPTEVAEIETENAEEQTEVENIETVTEAVEVQLGGEEDAIEPAEAQADIEAEPEAVETAETKPEVVETVETAETEPEIVETVEAVETEPEVEETVETAETEPEVEETVETAETEPEETVEAETEDEYVETVEAEPETEAQSETAEPTEAESEPETTETEPEEETEAEPEEEAKTEAEAEPEEEPEEETKAEAEEETEEETKEEAEAETEEGTEEETAAEPETVEQSANASISVDLSSVDLMQAATVEGDTVTLAVSDLLNAEDDAVNLEGDLHVEAEEFAAAATVTDSDVEVQDGVITLTAEALESGTVSLELQTETTEDDVTTVTTQTVDITLTRYTRRTSDAIASDEGVEVVPLGDNTLPNDAYATIAEAEEVPEHIEIAPVTETTAEAAKAFDIAVVNDNQDKIAQTGEVEVTVTPENLNVYSEVPEGATADSESLKLELYHVHDDGTVELVPDASFETDEEGNVTSFTFTTESFSTYVVKYTVDFTYVDVDGNEHFWQFPGSGSYRLMEVLSELGIEGETISEANLELTEAVGETSEDALYLTQDEETGEYSINSDTAFDDTYTLTVTLDNTQYVITVTDDAEPVSTDKYNVSVRFEDADGNNATPEGKYYVYAYVMKPDASNHNTDSKYIFKQELSFTNGEAVATINSFERMNGNPVYYAYDNAKNVTVNIVRADNGIQIQQNNNENVAGRILNKGDVKVGDVIENGDIYDGYNFTITQDSANNSASIVARKSKPYTYTVQVKNANGGDANYVTDNNSWYVFAEVTRNDGVYCYAEPLATGQNKPIAKFYRAQDCNNVGGALTTTAQPDEFVTFSILRPKADVGDYPWAYFCKTTDNVNTRALNGSTVANRYTLDVDGNVLTLREAATPTITVAESAGETIDLPRTDGNYYVVGEMAYRNGTIDMISYSVEPYTGAKAYEACFDQVYGRDRNATNAPYESRSNEGGQFLTGTRSYEPYLVFVPNSVTGTSDAVIANALLAGSCEVISNHDVLGKYRVTTTGGSLESPNTEITLTGLPGIAVTAHVADENGPKNFDDSKHYYVLAEMAKDGGTGYAYVELPLTAGSATATASGTLQNFVDEHGVTHFCAAEDSVSFYMVESESALSSLDAVLAATRYGEGQLMSKYVPTFNRNGDALTVTLEEIGTPAYAEQTVIIEFYNKAQTSLVKPNETEHALNAADNYYVLAWLTEKDAPKSRPVGWAVLPVDRSALGANGTWTGTLGTDAFNVCDANLNAIDSRTMGCDPSKYRLNVRLYRSATQETTYNGLIAGGTDAAPNGYDFKGVFTAEKADPDKPEEQIAANTAIIRLHEAYANKEYGIRVFVDQAGLEIPEGEYLVRVKLTHETGDDTYAYAKLVVDPATEGLAGTPLQFYLNNGHTWMYKGGSTKDPSEDSNLMFTGNEKGVEIELFSLVKSSIDFDRWGQADPAYVSQINIGESINLYTPSIGERESVEVVDAEHPENSKICIYDVIRFTKDVNGVTIGQLKEALSDATNFGLYTEILSKHATDMESNIGAAHLTGPIGADYGFSHNNLMVNQVKVTKRWLDSNGQGKQAQVELRLYPVTSYNESTHEYTLGTSYYKPDNPNGDGTVNQITTDSKGVAVFNFSKLPAGRYVLKEVVGGQEYAFDSPKTDDVITAGNGTNIMFADGMLEIRNINVNINYFGDIADSVPLYGVIRHANRCWAQIVTEDENDYNRLVTQNGGEGGTGENDINQIALAGDASKNAPEYDIEADMANLRDLSRRLAASGSSETVKIVNTTYEYMNSVDALEIKGDGRFVVVNVDMSNAPNVATIKVPTRFNGVTLDADFGKNGSEYSSKVLYNFVSNGQPYTGKINTVGVGAGVLLAPGAIVADLGGNWGGTIICHEAQHTGSEIHSDSQNKIQKINTALTNTDKKLEIGDLALRKVTSGEAAQDNTTWFTFVVNLKDDNNQNVTEDYIASGLESGTEVRFVNGVARVQVRANNKVTITGIPAGYTYEVTEVQTPETAHYRQVNITNGSGTIQKNRTVTATVENTYKDTEGCEYAPKVTKVIQDKSGAVLATDQWPVKAQTVGFTFALASADESPCPGMTLPTETMVTATATYKSKTFEGIAFEYVREDGFYPHTYQFSITEQVPEEQDRIPGVTYCETPIPLTVVVDVRSGSNTDSLYVKSVQYDDIATASGVIVNTYDSVKAQPKAYKKLDGQAYDGSLKDGNNETIEFTFQLTPVSVDGVAVEKPTTVTAITDHTADNPYEAAFPEMEFTKPGTYVYRITELDESDTHTNIAYDKTELFWKVVVTRDGMTGKLTITTNNYYTEEDTTNHATSLSGNQDGSQAVFENHELTNFHFIKIWTNGVNIEEAIAWPKNTSITVTMKRKHLSGDVDENFSRTCVARSDGEGKVTIDGAASGTTEWTLSGEESKNYRFDISGLEKYDDEGNAWVYYAQETGVPYGFHVKYGANNSGEYAWEQNEYKIYNHLNTVHLPATGGVGTNALYALGGGLVLLAALGWVLGSRKRRDDEA